MGKSKEIAAWEIAVSEANILLSSKTVAPSEVIISAIKKVNPTMLHLNEADKERGYEIKSMLQNLLLVNYGSLFKLEKLAWDEEIVLIIHKSLPFVDACHTKIHKLSVEAFSALNVDEVPQNQRKAKLRKSYLAHSVNSSSLEQLIKQAKHHIDYECDYEQARAQLENFYIDRIEDLPLLERAVQILNEELGLWNLTLSLLCNLPRNVLKDRRVRELLAQAYWQTEEFSVARVIFEELPVNDLSKKSLFYLADIKFREGNSLSSYKLLQKADELPNYVDGLKDLRGRVEAQLNLEAQSIFEVAFSEFDKNNFATAKRLAQEALDIYPSFTSASSLIRIVDEIAEENLKQELWMKLDEEWEPATRLRVLRKLLPLDINEASRINDLIGKEMHAVRQIELQQRISKAASCLAAEDFSAFFDHIFPILKENPEIELSSLSSHCPLAEDLLTNEKIISLKANEAKESWLRYIKAVNLYESANYVDCLKVCISLRKSFGGISNFAKMMDDLYKKQSDFSRSQVKALLDQMVQSCNDWTTFDSHIKKIQPHFQYLNPTEMSSVNNSISSCKTQLKAKDPQSWHLDLLKKALLKGHHEEAERLRSQIYNKERVTCIENEVAAMFEVVTTSIQVGFNSVEIDLNVQQGDRLEYFDSYRAKIVASNDNNEVVIIDTVASEAYSFHFPNLNVSKCRIVDILEDADVFLIEISNDCYISAKLTPFGAKILFLCDLMECFGLGSGSHSYISDIKYGADTNKYLVMIIGDNRNESCDDNILALGNLYKNCIARETAVDMTDALKRLCSDPYNLLVYGYGTVKTVDSFLKPRQVLRDGDIEFLAIDKENKQLYFQTTGATKSNDFSYLVLDYDLNTVKTKVGCISGFNHCYCVKCISDTHGLVYFDMYDCIYFFSLKLNNFSTKYKSHNILPDTANDDILYCIYNSNEQTVSLANIGGELHSCLKWETDSSSTSD